MYSFLEILSIETGRFLRSPIKISVFQSPALAKDDQIRPISDTFGECKIITMNHEINNRILSNMRKAITLTKQ